MQDAPNQSPFYNEYASTRKMEGAHLPHWHQDGVIYFITFRLADSLPQEKLKLYRSEKELWLTQNPDPRTVEQQIEYHRQFTERIQKWLDADYGSMLLKDPAAHKAK